MDDHAVTFWVAALGVAGTVLTSAIGWHGSRKTGRAQVAAALKGVEAQAGSQRQETIWQARRDAYSGFLGQVEVVRMALKHAHRAVGATLEISGGAQLPDPDLRGADAAVKESLRALWFRESTLRLTLGPEAATEAETLVTLAREAADALSELADTVWAPRPTTEPERAFDQAMARLTDGIEAWATQARLELGTAEG